LRQEKVYFEPFIFRTKYKHLYTSLNYIWSLKNYSVIFYEVNISIPI
jgi:hypothetical protein